MRIKISWNGEVVFLILENYSHVFIFVPFLVFRFRLNFRNFPYKLRNKTIKAPLSSYSMPWHMFQCFHFSILNYFKNFNEVINGTFSSMDYHERHSFTWKQSGRPWMKKYKNIFLVFMLIKEENESSWCWREKWSFCYVFKRILSSICQ